MPRSAGAGNRHLKCRLSLTGAGTGAPAPEVPIDLDRHHTYKLALTGTGTENRHQVPVVVPALKVPVYRNRQLHYLLAPAPVPPGADFIPGTRLCSKFISVQIRTLGDFCQQQLSDFLLYFLFHILSLHFLLITSFF